MSKPLELTIYPPAECTCTTIPDFMGIPTGRPPRKALSIDCGVHLNWHATKRLADAELAAEYWAQVHDSQYSMTCELATEDEHMRERARHWGSQSDRKAQALHRFATTPHYFEATESESDTE